ncbi:hypothetical protein KUCAC02_011983, partial [Chaenocephalus aceratus]
TNWCVLLLCVCVTAGSDVQCAAAAGSPAAGSGDQRGELETRAVLPVHPAGVQPRGPEQPD